MIKQWIKNLYIKIRFKLSNTKYGKQLIQGKREIMYSLGGNVYTNFKHGMPWGFVHPDHPHNGMGYNKMGILSTFSGLILSNESFNGKIMHEGIEYHPKVVSGCLHARKLFKYGQFEIDCVVPKNGKTWPSFWMFGLNWPPEIDIFEFTPNSDRRGKKVMAPNVHYKTAANKENSLQTTKVGKPGDRIRVGLDWTSKYIRWYYNGVLLREISSTKIMKYFQEEMYLIVSTGVTKDYDEEVFHEDLVVNSVMYKSNK